MSNLDNFEILLLSAMTIGAIALVFALASFVADWLDKRLP